MDKASPAQPVSSPPPSNGLQKPAAPAPQSFSVGGPALRRFSSGGPAAGAVVGTSIIVLLVELARSGALEQYKDALAPLIGWGPGLLILVAFLWLAHSYAPPLIESQRSTAMALQKLADTVEHSANSQHDLVLAMQVNSDKLEQVRHTVGALEEQVQQLKHALSLSNGEEWRNARH